MAQIASSGATDNPLRYRDIKAAALAAGLDPSVTRRTVELFNALQADRNGTATPGQRRLVLAWYTTEGLHTGRPPHLERKLIAALEADLRGASTPKQLRLLVRDFGEGLRYRDFYVITGRVPAEVFARIERVHDMLKERLPPEPPPDSPPPGPGKSMIVIDDRRERIRKSRVFFATTGPPPEADPKMAKASGGDRKPQPTSVREKFPAQQRKDFPTKSNTFASAQFLRGAFVRLGGGR